MKRILQAFTLIMLLASCSSSRDYLLRGDQDKTVFDIVKRLNKKSTDEDATKALAQVYTQVQQRHLKNINSYIAGTNISKWDKLINEYNVLQEIYNAIENSDAARKLVTPTSYQNEISSINQAAAEDYYRLGESYLANNTRNDARNAYNTFKKAGSWVKDYKDIKAKMQEAFDNSTINVVINPIQDNSFFLNTGWGNMGYNYSNEYFQQNLVRDLGGKYATRYPARFYTEQEASRNDIQPDWIVDLTLRDMDIPRPSINNYSRNLNKQIQTGTDTAGKPVYKTVYATLNIQRQYFNARAQMDLNIADVITHESITYNSYSNTYNWQHEVATYTGDIRALSNNDLNLINNSNYNVPRREDILNEYIAIFIHRLKIRSLMKLIGDLLLPPHP